MKNNLNKFLIICICLFTVYFILINAKVLNENILYAINLWITRVFPSLFPMFIINEILICMGFPLLITKLILRITNNRLKINIYAIYVFIMSIFSGTPSNAIILKSLVEKNELDFKDASYILAFTFFSNPLFLWTMLSLSFNPNTVLKIILINYAINIIIFLLFKNKLSNTTSLKELDSSKNKISNILNKSIKKSLDALLMILGTITFYIIISTILVNCFDLNLTIETLIKGFLELTQGLNNLTLLNISTKLKEIIAISIISFGGLSIHSQISNIISDTNIKYKYFFFGRITHTILSIFLIILF